MEPVGESACPICFKVFSFKEIDVHVNKCLFLNNEEPQPSSSNKRLLASPEDNASKKLKFANQANKTNQSPMASKKRESLDSKMNMSAKSSEVI